MSCLLATVYRGHPLGRGSNRKSVSVPIFFLSVFSHRFSTPLQRSKLIRSCYFVGLSPNRVASLGASDPVSHPSGSCASLQLALGFRAERSPNSRDLLPVRSLSYVLSMAALRRRQATTFRLFAFSVRPILITQDPENIQLRAVFIQFHNNDGSPRPAGAEK